MLMIRKEQMNVFGDYMLRKFKDRMERHLRSTFPKRAGDMTVSALLALIDDGIEKAAGYDIILEDDVRTFLEYMMSYSPDFDSSHKTPWAGEILSQDIPGPIKMVHLKKTAPIKMEV